MTGKIFISYSHDSQSHCDRILGLANRLRADRIDAEIDQYESSPPEGWPKWMERQIRQADYVLVVCTERYFKRVMGTELLGKGKGVKWESSLSYQHIYEADTLNRKFIPIVFDPNSLEFIPDILKAFTNYRLEEDYSKLVQRLLDRPPTPRPPLGGVTASQAMNTDKTIPIELSLNEDFQNFNAAEQEAFLSALKDLLRTGRDLKIKNIRPGSVRLTVDLSPEELERLNSAIRSGALEALKVESATELPRITSPRYVLNYVTTALESLSTEDQRRAFAIALSMSMKMGSKTELFTPLDIRDRVGFGLSTQQSLGISLSKKSALDFLNDIGITVAPSLFRHWFSADRYERFFGRKPAITRGRVILLTYAEWLYLVDNPIQIDLPEIIQKYSEEH